MSIVVVCVRQCYVATPKTEIEMNPKAKQATNQPASQGGKSESKGIKNIAQNPLFSGGTANDQWLDGWLDSLT